MTCSDHICPKCQGLFEHELGGGDECNVIRSPETGLKALRRCDLCTARSKAPQLDLFKESACA